MIPLLLVIQAVCVESKRIWKTPSVPRPLAAFKFWKRSLDSMYFEIPVPVVIQKSPLEVSPILKITFPDKPVSVE